MQKYSPMNNNASQNKIIKRNKILNNSVVELPKIK